MPTAKFYPAMEYKFETDRFPAIRFKKEMKMKTMHINPKPLVRMLKYAFVPVVAFGVTGCGTTNVLVREHRYADNLADVEPSIPVALRKTHIQLSVTCDIVKIEKMERIPGKNDRPVPGTLRYKVFPRSAADAVAFSVSYREDPDLRFRIMLEDGNGKAVDIKNLKFTLNDDATLASVDLQTESKGKEIVEGVVSTGINIARSGIAAGLFAEDTRAKDDRAKDEYWQTTTLEEKLVIRDSFDLQSMKSGKVPNTVGTYEKDYTDFLKTEIALWSERLETTEIQPSFDTIRLQMVAHRPIRDATTARRLLDPDGSTPADQDPEAYGIPWQEPAPAHFSLVLGSSGDLEFQDLNVHQVVELGGVNLIPLRFGFWIDQTVSAKVRPSGMIQEYTYKRSSQAAKVVETIDSVSGTLKNEIPKLIDEKQAKRQEEETEKLAILEQELQVLRAQNLIDNKITEAEAEQDPVKKAGLELEVEELKGSLEIEKAKLDMLRRGFTIS